MAKTIDEYIAAQPEATRSVLKRVRNIIRKAVPGAEETISYKIPAYKLNGKIVSFSLRGRSTTRSTPPAIARGAWARSLRGTR